jgi:hypothetical protein
MKSTYHSKTEAIIDLQARGYDHDFILKNECIHCIQQNQSISPDDFEVIEAIRFDGKRRMRDNCIIYAIELLNNDMKGILMTPYSTLIKGLSIRLWSKLANDL